MKTDNLRYVHGVESRKRGGGRKKKDHIFPADKLHNRQTLVSRPEESNLKDISGRMSAEQVDHDVMNLQRHGLRMLDTAIFQTVNLCCSEDE